MISLEQLAPVDAMSDAMSDALEAGRRSLASVDRDAIAESARTAARSVMPDDWFRPRRQRWPFVAIALLVAAAMTAVFLLRRPLLMAASPNRPTSGNERSNGTNMDSAGTGVDGLDRELGNLPGAKLLSDEGEASWIEAR